MSNQTQVTTSVPQDKAPIVEYLTFMLGGEEYGINIYRVQELRGYESVTRIANAKDYIKGVINLRGMIVPIIDLRIKLDTGAPSYTQFTAVIVLNVSNCVVGIVVDGVSEVVTFTPEQIKEVPQLGSAQQTDYVVGMGTSADRMVTLVDIELLLADADFNLITRTAA